MNIETILILLGVCVFASFFLGFPIGFTLAGVGAIFSVFLLGPEVTGKLISTRIMGLMTSFILLAAPLFIFMGSLLQSSGMMERMFNGMHKWLGGLRGGLAMVVIVIATIFAACVGIIGASVTTMGLIALPAMLKAGYDKRLATGVVMAGGVLGILIPPSIMIVFYAPMANVALGRLLLGAFIPGLILALLYLVYIGIRCYFQPKLGPPLPVEERRMTITERLSLLPVMLPPLFLILAVLGTIFLGIATPTEAAGVGALASVLLVIIFRRGQTFRIVKESTFSAIRITCMALTIAIGASIIVGLFLRIGGGQIVQELLINNITNKWLILGLIIFIVFLLGYVIDWFGILFLVVPIITPVVEQLGFDGVWVGMLIMMILQTSFLTPPLAYAIFFLKGVSPPEVTLPDLYRAVVPFIIIQLIGLALVWLFPQLTLWLPSMMFKIG